MREEGSSPSAVTPDALVSHRRPAGREPARDPASSLLPGLTRRRRKEPIMSLPTIDPARAKRLSTRAPSWSTSAKPTSTARERVPGARQISAFQARRRRRAQRQGGDLPLPFRRAHRCQCAASRSRSRLRGLYPRRRHRRLEEGRPARSPDTSQPIEIMRQVQFTGRRPGAAGHSSRRLGRTGVPGTLRFRRRGPRVRRDERLVRDGEAAWPDAWNRRFPGTATA